MCVSPGIIGPSDVSDRPVADPRLLLAAIYSEVCDINQLRAKCHVVHRDKISDLSGWKKRPDRFYLIVCLTHTSRKSLRLFHRTTSGIVSYYPSINDNYLTNLICNAVPDNIRDVLISRYEFGCRRKEVIPDLTDTVRLCDTCQEWCPR